jgi:hypothetical protein
LVDYILAYILPEVLEKNNDLYHLFSKGKRPLLKIWGEQELAHPKLLLLFPRSRTP